MRRRVEPSGRKTKRAPFFCRLADNKAGFYTTGMIMASRTLSLYATGAV